MIRQFASFLLGESLFGIDVLLIREINQNIDITPVNPSPEFLLGLMNLRGQIVAVTDLGIRLGLKKREITAQSCCIVLKTTKELDRILNEGLIAETTSNDTIGLLVDKIGDMTSIDDMYIERPPANINGVDGKYLGGVIKLEHELLATLKIKEILAI
ncbi:MAG: chemotaxis protein CheW [Chitinivibrionales bacterium]|nr:chemotaxis protein CheW [Chitinivibrionales bacterium]